MITKETKCKALATAFENPTFLPLEFLEIPHIYIFFGHVACRGEHFFHCAGALFCLSIYLLFQVCAKKYKQSNLMRCVHSS